jgi:hypothetical protein
MKKYLVILIFGSVFACTTKSPFDPTSYVDPQIGSVHGRWFFYTPAALPFGMAKLPPPTPMHTIAQARGCLADTMTGTSLSKVLATFMNSK